MTLLGLINKYLVGREIQVFWHQKHNAYKHGPTYYNRYSMKAPLNIFHEHVEKTTAKITKVEFENGNIRYGLLKVMVETPKHGQTELSDVTISIHDFDY